MDYIDKINKVNYFNDVDWSSVKTPRYWFENNPIITQAFNVFSLLIPDAERFIVRSLRPYESKITDPELSAELKSFFREEFTHSLEHTRFNQDLKRHGYPVDFIAKFMRISYHTFGKLFSKKTNVAISVCFEHFTVMVAKPGFEKEILEPGASVIYDLFLWHAYEEVSHRSLIFDMYDAIGGGYIRRVWAMMISTLFVFFYICPVTLYFLLTIDIFNRRGVMKFKYFKSTMKFIWSIRAAAKYYRSFFKIKFRP